MIRNRANKAVSDEHSNFRYSTTDKYLQIFPYIGYEINHKEINVLIYTLTFVAKCNKIRLENKQECFDVCDVTAIFFGICFLTYCV